MRLTPIPQHAAHKACPGLQRRGASGFPSPADDYLDAPLDLHRQLVPRPASTFFMRVEDSSQAASGFQRGDLLVVDRGLTPQRGDWVVAVIDGELCLRQLDGRQQRLWLCPPSRSQARLPLDGESDCRLWGVVHYLVHGCRQAPPLDS
ncbi:translesion error-prone DNA polymerase V autoproteolytic subunit [Halomonas sp. ML-15]|uniref:LexA family protein n=1 Tax=Halomonas sp. ML-15 TaxID=2773305 RepID=UPI001745F2A2|nr:translesion error-prone DNA polymerase V autoproteolytic subunit [Halomonas sp. ML-15]MBD3895814.1 translesion error-prone DNA polymerase V autoproteolytic subunit [Halomonas sp. ML-15]